MASPTLDERLLSAELRRARLAHGIDLKTAANGAGTGLGTVHRMEQAAVRLKPDRVRALLEFYGLPAGDIDAFLARVERARAHRGWWTKYTRILTPRERDVIALESAASLVRTYSPDLVPVLLRTEEYAHAVLRHEHPNATAQWISRAVELQMTRQQRFFAADPDPDVRRRVWAVIEQNALRRRIGSLQERRRQYEQLHELAQRPQADIVVQILPTTAQPCAAAAYGPFTVLRYAHAEVPDHIICGTHGWRVLDDPRETTPWRLALDLTMMTTPVRPYRPTALKEAG